MNFKIYVIKPLQAGTTPFIFQAPSDLVAIKTLLLSTVDQKGSKLYDHDLELIDTSHSLTSEGNIDSSLFSKPKSLGLFSEFFKKIDEYNILPPQSEEVTNG